MSKICYREFNEMLQNPDIPDERLRPYLVVEPSSSPFDPVIVPDPDKVDLTEIEADIASAMRIGNGLSRWRRQRRFWSRLNSGEKLPVLVSEGDSWFQFPFLIDDVIDHLSKDYLIFSLGAAGDTADNMVNRRPEYMKALREQKSRVSGFLFSAAGNDVIGEDENEKPVLLKLIKQNDGSDDAQSLVDKDALDRVLELLDAAYRRVILTVRAEAGFETLPIIVHGYDFAFPYPFRDGNSDPRHPSYAAKNEWLGAPLDERQIFEPVLRREIIKVLINELYGMLDKIAADHSHVFVVDVRNTLTDVGDWNDEIHGTDAGFARVADKFRAVLRSQAGIGVTS